LVKQQNDGCRLAKIMLLILIPQSETYCVMALLVYQIY